MTGVVFNADAMHCRLNLNSFGVACGREMADFCGFREAWIEN